MSGELQAKKKALENLWRQGLSGYSLLEKHTRLLDDFLIHNFNSCQAAGDMALVALGGYGRGELFPFSDIDIMLLHKKTDKKRLNEVAEAVFYPLWDAGLEVGHGVRTPETCLSEAKKNFFLEVSLLDARLLAGSKVLFDELNKKLRRIFVEGKRREFFENMLTHRLKRHQRFGNHSYLLEPNIKECRGGFRDIQAILWTAKVIFGLKNLASMEESGLFSPDERKTFEEAWNHLVKIRNRLHYISGRKNDQLYFEHQEEMAAAFGYSDSKEALGVESFMREVHSNLRTIARTAELFFEHVENVLRPHQSRDADRFLEKGIEIRSDKIYCDRNLLKKRPLLLMRIFACSAATGLPIHHQTRKLVQENLRLVDSRLRTSRRMADAFLQTLQASANPLTVLSSLLDTGMLAAYLPEFQHISSLAQHDVYHVYTVDRHLLQTVVEVHKLALEKTTVFTELKAKHLLYLAALLHDIGKGYSRNHSEYGAELAAAIGERLGLPETENKCLAFLVQEHLFLPETAMRRDLEDDNLIRRCAAEIGDTDRLAMLYLLSIADARATGPMAWNDWKAALLQQLFLKINHVLEQPKAIVPDDPDLDVKRLRTEVRDGLGWKEFDLDRLPDDYFRYFSPEEIISHIFHHQELERQQLLLAAENKDGHWSLLIMSRDRPGLLAKICGVLALHHLQVLAARIFTWSDGTVVDVLDVTPALNCEFGDQNWQSLNNDLKKAINFQLGLAHRLDKMLHSRENQILKAAPGDTARVEIDASASDSYTVIEVYAENRSGLLYDVTRTLWDFGINTYRARIATAGDQVVDVFYVLDYQGQKINDPEFRREIHQALLHSAG